MESRELISRLYDQIEGWQNEIDQYGAEYYEKAEELEVQIDKAFVRINAEKCKLAEETKVKLKVIYSRQ